MKPLPFHRSGRGRLRVVTHHTLPKKRGEHQGGEKKEEQAPRKNGEKTHAPRSTTPAEKAKKAKGGKKSPI